jgi:hypothetical protein
MRPRQVGLALIAGLLATTDGAQAQAARERTAIGIVYNELRGRNFVGPSVSRRLFDAGMLQGRWTTSVAFLTGTTLLYACPNASSGFCDWRKLGGLGSSAVSIEFGRAVRETDGGAFLAVQGGLTALRWASGGVAPDGNDPAQPVIDYAGRTTFALSMGGIIGVDIPLLGRPTRLQLGVDFVEERWQRLGGLSLSIAHRW